MVEVPRDPPIVDPPIRLAVCVSGEGTTLQNLIDLIRSRRLNAQIVQVVASRPRIGAIARAEAVGIPLALANRNARSRMDFSASVLGGEMVCCCAKAVRQTTASKTRANSPDRFMAHHPLSWLDIVRNPRDLDHTGWPTAGQGAESGFGVGDSSRPRLAASLGRA